MATAASGPIDQSAKAISRYQAGYRLATSISGLSQICKGVGVLAGILAIVFGVMGSETLMRPNASMVGMASVLAQHNVYLVSVILFGGLVALCGWIIGVALDGYGQYLQATLDTAVNGSPFLSNPQRAQLMRIG